MYSKPLSTQMPILQFQISQLRFLKISTVQQKFLCFKVQKWGLSTGILSRLSCSVNKQLECDTFHYARFSKSSTA